MKKTIDKKNFSRDTLEENYFNQPQNSIRTYLLTISFKELKTNEGII